MQLEKQVCSLELAKRLKELGVKQESLFWWREMSIFDGNKEVLSKEWVIIDGSSSSYVEQVSAFTVAELGEMLPWDLMVKIGTRYDGDRMLDSKMVRYQLYISWDSINNLFTAHYSKGNTFVGERNNPGSIQLVLEKADTEADARAKMLIYLLENDLLTPKE